MRRGLSIRMAASRRRRDRIAGSRRCLGAVPRAVLTPRGRAIASPSAPLGEDDDRRRQPHPPPALRLGGGYRNWNSRGYVCSGSVSYVLHAGGLLDYALDSTGLMHLGGGGPGSWVRIYANKDHAHVVVADLRWDTSMTEDGDRTGPGWSEYMRSGHGFRLRHPLGLLSADPQI